MVSFSLQTVTEKFGTCLNQQAPRHWDQAPGTGDGIVNRTVIYRFIIRSFSRFCSRYLK